MTVLDKAFIKAFSSGATIATASNAHGDGGVRPPRFLKADTAPRATVSEVALAGDAGHGLGRHERLSARSIAPHERSAMAPLSSFSGEPTVAAAPAAAIEAGPLKWPAACEALLAHASREFNAFSQYLIERAGAGQKTIALASGTRGEGRTTVCLALAKHLAGLGLRVLVVDADAEHPNLADRCGISTYTGWNRVLENELAWGEALVAPADDCITLMPWRDGEPRQRTWYESAHAAAGFAMLRGLFDLIVVDTAALDSAGSAAELVGLERMMSIDAFYLVQDVRRGGTRESLAKTCQQFHAARIRVDGAIENFVGADRPATALEAAANAGHELI